MKKGFAAMAAVIALGAAFGAAACRETPSPAPGAPVLEFAGSLQMLYGENGYPQAVLVAKNSVIESDPAAVARMTSYMEGAEEYLSAADPAEVVGLLAGKYAEGLAPSLNAKNLTKTVIGNCSVNFTAASEAKGEVNAFLGKLIELDGSFTAMPEDAFYFGGGEAEGEQKGRYSVYAPDGAPALSLAYAISETEGDAFEYHIVQANTIAAKVTGAEPAADFCILPVNAAAKVLGKGTSYQMLGVVTHGNMYFLRTANDQWDLTDRSKLEFLIGKTVGVVQLANVPGLTLRAVLAEAKIPYQILDGDAEPAADKVNLKAYVDATTIAPATGCDYFLCPEPAASAKVGAFKAQSK